MDAASLLVSGTRRGLTGHLKLDCRRDETGRAYLARQSTRAPLHLGKPYWDGESLGVQVVNSTAGLLEGDRLECSISVQAGARMAITTPSATRIFTMKNDRAEVRQHFSVGPRARLIYLPAQIVPHRRSRYLQKTRIEVATDAELLFVDSLAPGRVAHGETGQFDELDFETDLELGGRLVIRERFKLPGSSPLAAHFYACAYILTGRLTRDNECWGSISALHTPECWVGVSEVHPSVWTVKILSKSSLLLRAALSETRHILEKVFPFCGRGAPF